MDVDLQAESLDFRARISGEALVITYDPWTSIGAPRERIINIDTLTAVEFTPARWWANGSLRFTYPGSKREPNRAFWFGGDSDPDAVTFQRINQADFERIYEALLARINPPS